MAQLRTNLCAWHFYAGKFFGKVRFYYTYYFLPQEAVNPLSFY